MASTPKSTEPQVELQHQSVPGYAKAFFIAIAVMGLYLAIILITSPGSAKSYGHGKAQSESSK